MARKSKRGEAVRDYILNNVEDHPSGISAATTKKFNISRQAVNKHIKRLCDQGSLVSAGSGRSKTYQLANKLLLHNSYALDGTQSEDKVWREAIAPLLKGLPDNVMDIWHYGFTEMFNNAIDHSMGTRVELRLKENPLNFSLDINDDGEGIFKKITRDLNLDDERHAALELAKGKFTTDPENHTGEGIFFTSRVFDYFLIISAEVYFSHTREEEYDWIFDDEEDTERGTYISMELAKNSQTRLQKVFDSFTSGGDVGFSKTVIPVSLALYGDDKLVSRSQAKRVLVRVERFKNVLFDFENVESIGQAFADEIFRVFRNKNPNTQLGFVSANSQVQGMVERALQNKD